MLVGWDTLHAHTPAAPLPTAWLARPPAAVQGEGVHEPNYGCKAVQAEWEFSGRRSLMARECMQQLAAVVQERTRRQLYLDGWAGSGKSVALYSLVAWARAQGWLALYLPSAFSLVQSECVGRACVWPCAQAGVCVRTSVSRC